MTVHPYQAGPNCKHSRKTFRACVKIPIELDVIYASNNIRMLKSPHDILVHLVALGNGINPDIGTFKKDRGDVFTECFAERFKANFLRYVQ